MSGDAGSLASKWIGGSVLGATAFVGRNTVGRAASKLTDENSAVGKRFRDIASKSALGEFAFKGTKGIAGSSLDLRDQKHFKAAAAESGVNLGKAGGKGGYQKVIDTQVKARQDFVKDLAKGRDGEDADRIKEQYATRISSKTLGVFGDPESLFTVTGRKNKDAAAKIMKDVDTNRNKRNVKKNKETLRNGEQELAKLTKEHETMALADSDLAVRQRKATGQATQTDKDLEGKLIAKKTQIDTLEKKNEDLRKRINQGEKENKKQALKEAVTDVSKELDSEKPAPESKPAEEGAEKK